MMKPRFLMRAVLLVVAVGGCADTDQDLTLKQLVTRAQDHQTRDEHDEAIRYYTLAIEREPRNFAMRNNRATAYMAVGEYDKVLVDLTAAIRFGKDQSPDPYINRASLYYNAGLLEEAKVDIDQAIEVSPTHGEAHWVRGAILMAQNKTQEAKRDLQKARDLGFQPRDEAASAR